eukprot:329525-Chlamydomonas_euryale.AAC.1
MAQHGTPPAASPPRVQHRRHQGRVRSLGLGLSDTQSAMCPRRNWTRPTSQAVIAEDEHVSDDNNLEEASE